MSQAIILVGICCVFGGFIALAAYVSEGGQFPRWWRWSTHGVTAAVFVVGASLLVAALAGVGRAPPWPETETVDCAEVRRNAKLCEPETVCTSFINGSCASGYQRIDDGVDIDAIDRRAKPITATGNPVLNVPDEPRLNWLPSRGAIYDAEMKR